MKRRTYIAGLASIAGGGAITLGSGAVDIWATRNADISVTTDANGLIGLAEGEENSQFATSSGGTLGISLDNGQANGLNPDSRTVIDDIFRIRNQAGVDQVVWIKDVNDDGGLFGDEGPLHFFRGPVSTTTPGQGNGILGKRRRVFSQLDPVPGTPDAKQRLTITGLVPPAANIGEDPSDTQRQAWINAGHPVTVVDNGQPVISDTERREIGDATELSGVTGLNVVVGQREGRYFLTPGEEMKVGIAADFSGYDNNGDFELGQVLDSIEVVGREPDEARALATGDTEFNTGR